MHNKTLILYHGNCPDGFTSAWAAFRKFGYVADYIAVNHNDTSAPDIVGKDVYILDFSYKRPVLEELIASANSLLVLDHHESAEGELKGLPGCVFDMSRSGAGMSWDHFHPDVPRPDLIKYVEDRDLWNWALPDSAEINSVITSYDFTFDNWDMLHDKLTSSKKNVIGEGTAILRGKEAYVSAMMDQVVTSRFLGYDNIPVVNAPFINVSELCNRMAIGNEFSVGWRQISSGEFVYSFRSKAAGSNFNVFELAQKMGGGGHRHSAGFNSHLPPWKLTEAPPELVEKPLLAQLTDMLEESNHE